MSEGILEEIKLSLQFLFDKYGYKLKSHKYEPEHFGNSITILSSTEKPLVRIVNDRGDIMLDFATNESSKDWSDLVTIINFMDNNSNEKVYSYYELAEKYKDKYKNMPAKDVNQFFEKTQIINFAELLNKYFPLILEYFKPEKYPENYRLAKERHGNQIKAHFAKTIKKRDVLLKEKEK